MKPTEQPSQHTDRPAPDSSATDPSSKHRSTAKANSDLPHTSHWPATTELTGQPVVLKLTTNALEPSKDSFSSDSDSNSFISNWPAVDLYVEGGVV